MREAPDPGQRFPIAGIRRTVFLKNVVRNPLIEVGDYTYYDDPDDPEGFENNVLYHFPFVGDRLVIGRFCQIALQVRFIMNGAQHRQDGVSTYPFAAFGAGWSDRFAGELDGPSKGDLTIGNDVWIGYRALLMPGVSVGDGAIIGAGSVVTGDVPPYAVVAGNPARIVRMRFDDRSIRQLLELRWWDWSPETITRLVPEISSGDVDRLRAAWEASGDA